jgi:hypothetical protein
MHRCFLASPREAQGGRSTTDHVHCGGAASECGASGEARERRGQHTLIENGLVGVTNFRGLVTGEDFDVALVLVVSEVEETRYCA